MGIRTSLRRAICGVLDPIADVGEAMGKTVNMATTYVDNRAVKLKLTDREAVRHDTAEVLLSIQTKLDADPKLAKIFADLDAEFRH